ncbi:MAG: insulinase family protein [Deltaproteobacteria bacterium]|nr:insulinase family protein [Deltaproteobacteria bacterium]MBW1814928.1 insulinase family protein [Deltaproteobacteria bacterium]MBW1849314.1 insulinase family protein [Deltaproteobacteria bacterium]MBW1983083.1 insulinase family protein [Deltaproteobacteria bacterium]MBW2178852.1 insulinase family protein [Deltaproteobacteria bacterium]
MDENLINNTALKNGIRILSKQIPNVRSVSMGVWVDVGARDESLEENGLSHLIEHMIFKGTKRRNAFQIAKEFDAIGGHSNAFTSMENTCFHAKVLDSHTHTMIDILSDIFLNSVFDETEIEKERPVILQEIGMVEDSPDEYIHVLSGNAYWGDNPLGRSILGSRENIVSFGPEAVKSFFNRFYRPDRIVISAAGNIDHAWFVDKLEAPFKAVEQNTEQFERVTPEGLSTVDLHHRELELAHICIGTRGLSITDPRRYEFSLLSTILGGNMSSRLFQEIRERRGLAYSVYSFVNSYFDTGMFGVYAGVDHARATECIDVTIKELRKMSSQRVTTSELTNAKEHTKGNLLLSAESVDNHMVRLAQTDIHFGRYIPIQEVIEKIEAVTTDDILAVAESLFQSEDYALTILGPVDNKSDYENLHFVKNSGINPV